MSYDLPTIAEFKAIIPKMADEADEDIAANIQLASMFVSQSWMEKDFKPAIIYLAAHYILQQKSAVSTAGSSGGTSDAETFVSSVSFGDRKVSYGLVGGSKTTAPSQSASDADYGRSAYGRVYLTLRRRNVPVGLVISGANL